MKSMLFALLTIVIVFSTSTKAYTQDSAPEIPSQSELARYKAPGTNFIDGTVTANTRQFGRHTFSKVDVILAPFADFTVWYFKRIGSDLDHNQPDNSLTYPAALSAFSRKTTADENGYFIFRDLPPAKYLIIAIAHHEITDRPLERRTETEVDSNGDFVSVPVQVSGLAIRSETDALAASTVVPVGRGGQRIYLFDVLGANLCCKARV